MQIGIQQDNGSTASSRTHHFHKLFHCKGHQALQEKSGRRAYLLPPAPIFFSREQSKQSVCMMTSA